MVDINNFKSYTSDITRKQSGMEIYEALLELIISGNLKSGDRLSIKNISEGFNVSNTPVREALVRLENEGLLEKIPYQGFKIKEFSREEAKEIFETRAALESYAGKLAARRAKAQDRKHFSRLQELGREHLENDDLKAYSEYNKNFHNSIISFSKNSKLARNYQRIEEQISLFTFRVFRGGINLEKSFQEHEEIVELICQGKEQQVQLMLDQHIMDLYQHILQNW